MLKDWRTNEAGKTDAAGSFKTRAFLGKYAIRVTSGGQTKTVDFELRSGSAPVVVKLD